MENKKTIKKVLTWGVVGVLTLLVSLVGINNTLFSSLFSQNTTPVERADIYIPQNYEGSEEQIGEIEVKAGKTLSRVAGVQFTVNYPVNQLTITDASVSGLKTGQFFIVKNTSVPGSFQVSMAQATGVDLEQDDTIVKLTVELNNNLNSGDEISLALNSVSVADEEADTIPVIAQNGKITINDGGTLPGTDPYVQSITPDYALSSEDMDISIRGRNLPSSVLEIRLGNTPLENVQGNSSNITATVPAGISTGIYDLSITGTDGSRLNKEKAFTIIEQAEGLSIEAESSYFSPQKIKNDNEMETTLWVKVTDLRGVEDIEYVNVNLESIGGTPTNRLTPDKIVDKNQWFYLDEIKVPKTVATSQEPYAVTVSVTNKLGKVATGQVALSVIGDIEDNIAPVVHQAYTVPPYVSNNGEEPFSLYVYVTSDNGADTIGNVMVDLENIGAGVKTMSKEGESVGNGYWYKVDDLKVSTQIRGGDPRVDITATNVTGETGEGRVTIEVDASRNAPEVETSRSYTTPNAVANDGNTEVTLYAFVTDPDGSDDISSADIDLREIGLSPVNKMEEGEAEGQGKWFTFTTKVNMIVAPSSDPYKLKVTATDASGTVGKGNVLLKVLDTNPEDVISPQIEAVVPVSSRKIEVIFNKQLDRESIIGGGRNFDIVERSDITEGIRIFDATLNTRGNIVILETETQSADQPYTLIADDRVKDLHFNPVKAGYGDRADFRGFQEATNDKAPRIKLVTSTGPTTVEVNFWKNIKPSAVALDGADIKIYEVTNSRSGIKATAVHFKDPTTLVITTEKQKYGMSYGMIISNIESSQGVKANSLDAFFKGFTTPLIGDLNFDGKIDFADFTIFASVYRVERGFSNEDKEETGNTNSGTDDIYEH